jgi:serine phosphatase RsbU (regulator of sigma subunit)/pSer/pThr/pTyr-binding forkhead associated (FHA) protein
MNPSVETDAALVIVDPNGRRTRVPLHPFPFRIGRSPDNQLVLRDSRISRNHAQVNNEDGQCVLEDLGSRHGVWVNGERIDKNRVLHGSERIEFGVPDGYQLHFTRTGEEIQKLIAKPLITGETGRAGTSNLEKLRAVLEVARSLQSSFSADDVLNSVVDAALAVTGAERGFLLLFDETNELQVRSARAAGSVDLPADELRVPRKLIRQALETRRDLFSMSFDPSAADERSPGNTIADLELRSVVCVPLVRVSLSGGAKTQIMSAARSNAGVLYMDSRLRAVDLAGGNRELLQTLAIEASTVLENARLLEEERVKQHIEEELSVARRIQQSLLPKRLPDTGWFRVCGSSVASHSVGGDYFDLVHLKPELWSLVIADVAGHGVSSAIMASFLQGAFLNAAAGGGIAEVLGRVNEFLADRADHGKYATVFYAMLDCQGNLSFANAGHCSPLLVRRSGEIESLQTTSMPVGLVPGAPFTVETRVLMPGDRLVLYTDGVTEAQNAAEDFYGKKRLKDAVAASSELDCTGMHDAIQESLKAFTQGAEQSDDITLVVAEFNAAGTLKF